MLVFSTPGLEAAVVIELPEVACLALASSAPDVAVVIDYLELELLVFSPPDVVIMVMDAPVVEVLVVCSP